jgi:chemotaxis protein methyltransferase CheR
MKSALSQPLLSQLSKLLENEMGLYYPTKSWGDLQRRVSAAAPALGMSDTESCVRRLLSAPLTRQQVEILACHLTVGETYFFREKGCFDVLEEHIFPELIRACARSVRPLQIWSAGCCTGEEPYSIAILLDRLSQNSANVDATILATDINPVFLEKASKGLYGEWSFRGTPPGVKERYFKPRKNGQFEILPHIRKRVTFSYLNLAEEAYPDIINGIDTMDVIFCRNVSMYFSPDRAMKIGQRFYQSLIDGGWLILGPVEVARELYPQFKQTAFPTAIFYHKTKIAEPQVAIIEYEAPLPPQQLDGGTTPVQGSWPPSWVQNEEVPLLPEAAELCQPAVQKDKEEFEALFHTARSYANLGKLTEAASWCEKAIATNKLKPTAHYLLAIICQELGEGPKAIRSLRRALYLDPDFVLAHFALGNLCTFHGQPGEAERHFDIALGLLSPRTDDELLPESNGLTAGRLRDIVTSARANIVLASTEREAK